MRVIVLASQKGGSGKTTLAGHLAVVCVADHMRDRLGDCGRRIDEHELEALGAQDFEIGTQIVKACRDKGRRIRFPGIPPFGEAALRISVDHRDRARPGNFRLHRKMPG